MEYELTPLSRSLLGPIAAARAWAGQHWEELVEARESHDAAARLGRTG
ncbi:hypothetical protein [Streptomyces achromogenes]